LSIGAFVRAAVLEAFGGPEGLVVQSVPDPIPGPGEVLVKVGAVCVNRTDVHVMEQTNIGRNVVLPHIGGLDPAGVVVAHGPEVTEPALGTRVVARPMIPCLECRFCTSGAESVCERPSYIGVHRAGGFAELVALPARAVFPIPDGLDDEGATAAAHSVPVALHLLDAVGGVGPGDRVLVLGAAGGLGLAAVQIAHHLGAWVIGAVADPSKLDGLDGGPDAVVDYADPQSLPGQVRALTDGHGVTVVVDNVGSAELWPHAVASLDKGGRILTCGAHAGGLVTLDISAFYRLQLRLLATAGTTGEEFRRALDLVANGVVRPVRHGTWALEEIHAAFREMLARHNIGKIVVRVAP
jgi:NADPH:quinone reductase-like Zn-dependent oxidoreductase